jgi:hypothetical protein
VAFGLDVAAGVAQVREFDNCVSSIGVADCVSRRWKLPNCSLSVIGYSRAADKTAFWVPETKYVIDCTQL